MLLRSVLCAINTIRKAAEQQHELDNKIRDGAMTCEELRKEILNFKQDLRQLKAGVDPKIG